MGNQRKQNGFGARGANARASSLADQLLSGKPMGRPKRQDGGPKLKPRPKPKFGRRGGPDGSEGMMRSGLAAARRGLSNGRSRGWRFWTAVLVAFGLGLQALAGLLDWPSPTLGGRQLWTDIRVQGGWRVQCHAWTGHCRLLDARDIRRTWGSEQEVVAAFDAARGAGTIAAPSDKAVVLVHGLGRSRHSFDAMSDALAKQGYAVIGFNYASTRGPVENHARALNRVLGALDGVKNVHFVTHSLGAVVVRRALAEKPAWTDWMKTGRTVLIAGPNQGSAVAATLAEFAPARWLFGPALGTLADADAVRALPAPPAFATVAGTHDPLWFFDAPADGLVRTAETRLNGAREHVEVEAAHTFIMNDPRVIDFAVDFIGGG